MTTVERQVALESQQLLIELLDGIDVEIEDSRWLKLTWPMPMGVMVPIFVDYSDSSVDYPLLYLLFAGKHGISTMYHGHGLYQLVTAVKAHIAKYEVSVKQGVA